MSVQTAGSSEYTYNWKSEGMRVQTAEVEGMETLEDRATFTTKLMTAAPTARVAVLKEILKCTTLAKSEE